jgi:hypothetical protein
MTPENGDRPIRVLADQEYEPSADFVAKVRRKIYRRTAASQLASYSWHLPKVILVELARLIGHFVNAFGTNKEPKS